MSYVYIQPRGETALYTVGHYSPDGEWIPESDWTTSEQAADRVHFLNGGNRARTSAQFPRKREATHGAG